MSRFYCSGVSSYRDAIILFQLLLCYFFVIYTWLSTIYGFPVLEKTVEKCCVILHGGQSWKWNGGFGEKWDLVTTDGLWIHLLVVVTGFMKSEVNLLGFQLIVMLDLLDRNMVRFMDFWETFLFVVVWIETTTYALVVNYTRVVLCLDK